MTASSLGRNWQWGDMEWCIFPLPHRHQGTSRVFLIDPERPCSPKTWSLLWTPDLALGAFVKIKCVFQKELEFSTRSPITLLGGQWGNEAQDGTSGRGWFLGWGAVEGDKPDWGARNQWLVSRLRAEFTRARCFRRMRMTPLLERLIPANWLVTWY